MNDSGEELYWLISKSEMIFNFLHILIKPGEWNSHKML
jgi:hypothetical protein